MSANVWFEQVDKGLKAEIHNTVMIPNTDGTVSALPETNIVIRKPEEDFKIEVFPCVSIYNISYNHDTMRYNPNAVVMDNTTLPTKVVLQDSAIPFNLRYQIDFWAEYQTDMNAMTRTWLMKHFRQFNLTVTDDGGTERTCNVLIDGEITKSDLTNGDKRMFHSIVRLTVWVELDDEVSYNVSKVTDIDINVKS